MNFFCPNFDCIDMPFAYEVAHSLGMTAVENLLQDMASQLQSLLKIPGKLYAVAVGRFAFLTDGNEEVSLGTISERLRGIQASVNAQIPLNLSIHIGESGLCTQVIPPTEVLRRAVSALHDAITHRQRFMTFDEIALFLHW